MAMNKGIILSLLVLVLLVGGIGAWYVGSRLTRMEQRGVALTLKVTPTPEERKRLEKGFNEILDREELLTPIIKDFGLVEFYGVAGEDEAVAEMQERSEVYFKDELTLWIVHKARRYQREKNDSIGKRLGQDFVKQAFPGAPVE